MVQVALITMITTMVRDCEFQFWEHLLPGGSPTSADSPLHLYQAFRIYMVCPGPMSPHHLAAGGGRQRSSTAPNPDSLPPTAVLRQHGHETHDKRFRDAVGCRIRIGSDVLLGTAFACQRLMVRPRAEARECAPPSSQPRP